MKRTFIAIIIALALAAGASPVQAAIGPSLEDGCLQGGGSDQMCRGPEHLATLAAVECRLLGGGTICDQIDGRTINDDAVTAASKSWVARTLAYQRGLDDTQPVQEELWAHTHNSFNAEEYGKPSLYGTDPNQLYTIPHQLDMGIRAVEIDLHWAPSISGDPNAVIICHGTQINFQLTTVHAGCLPTDPLITDADFLPKIRTWLDDPDHRGEIVMLYLENQMQENGVDSADAHTQAADAIKATFGDEIYTPPAGKGCANLPMDISRRDIRNSGKRIIITGNCYSGGASPWNDVVFDRGPRWKEGGLDHGTDFTPERCALDRVSEDYPHNWIRHWGDETGLSDSDPTTLQNGEAPHGGGDVTVDDARNMVRCGVNMIGFDNLMPFDARLAALAWSWADNEPQRSFDGACAVSDSMARFRSEDCSVQTKKIVTEHKTKDKKKRKRKHKAVTYTTETIELPYVKHAYACFGAAGWHVTTKSERFSSGDAVCAAEHLGVFEVPRNGYANELLRAAKAAAGAAEVWVNYAYGATSGWAPGH